MGMYLNSKVPYESFKAVAAGSYFVDKSELLNEIIPSLGMEERFSALQGPAALGKVSWLI